MRESALAIKEQGEKEVRLLKIEQMEAEKVEIERFNEIKQVY